MTGLRCRNVRCWMMAMICCSSVYLAAQTEEEPWQQEFSETPDEESAERIHAMNQHDIRTIRINQATWHQLAELPNTPGELAMRVIAFRDTVGHFMSVYELLSIEGVTIEWLQNVSPWLSLAPANDRRITGSVTMRMVMKQPVDEGTLSRSQLPAGSPLKSSIRFKINYNAWSIGFKGEKDAGEPFGGKLMPGGFDFYSGYVQYRGNKRLHQMIIGDYRMGIGHGLLCNQLYAAGNSPAALYQPEETRVARPHTSLDEYNFFRGVTTTVKHNDWWITVFGSIKPLDGKASEYDPETGKVLQVSTIRTTGLHNTLSMLEGRHTLQEHSFGSQLTWRKPKMFAGISYLSTNYSVPIIPEPNYVNRLKFNGKHISGTSLYFGGFGHHAGATAELAWCNGVAALSGVAVARISDTYTFRLAARHIGTAYHAPYLNTLSATGTLAGESGLVFMLESTPQYGKSNRLMTDAGRIFSTKSSPVTGQQFFTVTAESNGYSGLLSYRGRVAYDTRSETIPEFPGSEFNPQSRTHRLVVRVAGTINATEDLRLHLRADACQRFDQEILAGYLLSAGFDQSAFRNQLKLSFRHTLFDTDHYLVRIYTHEQEAPGGFNMLMLNGKGSRTYLLVKGKITHKLQCWIKGGYTVRQVCPGESTMPTRWDWSFQITMNI